MSGLLTTVRTLGWRLWRRLRRTQSVAEPPYAELIREAERCQHNAQRAMRFCESGGPERLERAIEAADADNRDEWVDRGRTAYRALTTE